MPVRPVPRPVVVVAALALVAFLPLLVACWRASGPVLFDSRVMAWFPVPSHTSAEWDVWRGITDLASGPVRAGFAVAATAVVAFVWRDYWWAAAMLASPVAAAVLREGVRAAAARPRPPTASFFGDLGYGFPSGHATGICASLAVVVLFLWLALDSRGLKWGITAMAAAVCVLVGLSRVTLGAHWPTDVAGGFLFGASVSALTAATVAGPLRRRFRR